MTYGESIIGARSPPGAAGALGSSGARGARCARCASATGAIGAEVRGACGARLHLPHLPHLAHLQRPGAPAAPARTAAPAHLPHLPAPAPRAPCRTPHLAHPQNPAHPPHLATARCYPTTRPRRPPSAVLVVIDAHHLAAAHAHERQDGAQPIGPDEHHPDLGLRRTVRRLDHRLERHALLQDELIPLLARNRRELLVGRREHDAAAGKREQRLQQQPFARVGQARRPRAETTCAAPTDGAATESRTC